MAINTKINFRITRFSKISWAGVIIILVALFGLSYAPPYSLQIAGSAGGRPDTFPLQIAKSANDPRLAEQTNLNQAKILSAWDVTTGNSGQIVAVIDTGTNPDHEELVNRLWVNTDEIPGNGRDDDNNGYIDDYQGYNFMNDTPDIIDQNGHGTGVASIVAANTNNNLGMAGINWGCRLMTLKALNSAGGGEYHNVARALRYAADNGAQVINMSFGTYFDSTELNEAVDYAINHGVVIVAAAGNNSQNQLLYPAAYSNVIAVGAVDSSGQRASFSNWGTNLDVVAPGLNILMANYIGTNAYAYGSGTSFAAAHVTGIVSLMLARNSSLSPTQIENIIKSSATGYNNTLEYGTGLVNAASALGSTQISDHIVGRIVASSARAVADSNDRVIITVQVTNNDFPLMNHQVRAYINGPITFNGEFVDKRDVFLGNTDMSGTVRMELTSGIAGKKFIIFSDVTAGVSLGDLTLTFDPVGGPAQYNATLVSQNTVSVMTPGERVTLSLALRNTGNIPWSGQGSIPAGQLRLGTAHPADRSSKFYSDSWVSSNRAAILQQPLVSPGETGQFTFTVQAPTQPGIYKEYFNPVAEYTAWLPDLKIYWEITVANGGVDPVVAHYAADILYKSANLVLDPGQSGLLQIEIKNTGTAKWVAPGGVSQYGVVQVGTVNPYDRASSLASNWLSSNRTTDMGFALDPGDRVSLAFLVRAPNQPGVYPENFRLVAEYITWFGPAFGWTVTVR
ncbi:MAG: S8 family serine peptidase [Patescibacteria group bacterium]|jgi:hypothetical protein